MNFQPAHLPLGPRNSAFHRGQLVIWPRVLIISVASSPFSVHLFLGNCVRSFIGSEHPNPGEPYRGLFLTSYLPNNPAGQEVCNLLRSAFDTRLIFTIGKCLATGEDNKVVYNGIELKTNRSGGPAK